MQDEIKEHFGEKAITSHKSDSVIEARFKEMCVLSKDGLVSFKHFLFAVETWVGVDDDE